MKNAAKMLLFMLILTAVIFAASSGKDTGLKDAAPVPFVGFALGVLIEAILLSGGFAPFLKGASEFFRVFGILLPGKLFNIIMLLLALFLIAGAIFILNTNPGLLAQGFAPAILVFMLVAAVFLNKNALPELSEYSLLGYTVVFWFVLLLHPPSLSYMEALTCLPFFGLAGIVGTIWVLALCFTDFRTGNILNYISSLWMLLMLAFIAFVQISETGFWSPEMLDPAVNPLFSFPAGLVMGMFFFQVICYFLRFGWNVMVIFAMPTTLMRMMIGTARPYQREALNVKPWGYSHVQMVPRHALLIVLVLGGVLVLNHFLQLVSDFLLVSLAFLSVSQLAAMRKGEALPEAIPARGEGQAGRAPLVGEGAQIEGMVEKGAPPESAAAEKREGEEEKKDGMSAVAKLAATDRIAFSSTPAIKIDVKDLRRKVIIFEVIALIIFIIAVVFGCAFFYGTLFLFGSHGSHQNGTVVNESGALAQVEQQLQVPERNYSYSIAFMAAQSESIDPVGPQFLERSNVTEERNKTILWKFEPPLLAAAKKAGSEYSVARINMSGSNIVIGLFGEDSAVVAKELSHKVLYGGYGAEGCETPAWVTPEMDSGNSIEIDGKKYYFGDGLVSGDGRKGVMLYNEEEGKYDIWKDSATAIHGESIVLWTRALQSNMCLSWIEVSIVDNPVVAGEEVGGIETIVSEEGGINYTRLVSVSLPRGYFGDRP